MKIRKTSNRKKIIIITVIALLVLISAGALWYFVAQGNDNEDTRNTDINKVDRESETSPDIDEDISSPNTSEETASPESNPAKEGVDNSVQQNNETIQRGSGNTGTQNITISRIDASANTVTVVALVHGATEGTCNVTFTQNGQSVTGSAPVQVGPTYYACQIDTTRGQFPSGGVWQARVSINGASANGEVHL